MTSRRPALPRSAVLAFATALLAFLVLAAPSLSAQVVPVGAQRTLPAGTLNGPKGVAVDAAGDVFILSNGSETLLKLAPDGTVTTLASGLSTPEGVATDSSGNVYYDDDGTNKITEITTAGVSSTVASGISAPSGLAVDSVGNVYVGTTNGVPATTILKIAPGGAQSTVNTGAYTLAAGSVGLYVDSDGNLFIADAGNSRILDVSSAGVTTQVAASGLSAPFGVATDAAGNVFIADNNNNRVVEVPAGGGAQRTLGTGLSYPSGITTDASGNVYVADTSNNRVVEIQPSALNFGSANLGGGASVTWSLIYNFSGSETLTGASVVTQGAAGLDFAPVASGTTCAAGTFGTGTNQCLLNVNFTPVAPGTRLGAATLSTSSGTLITTFLAGTGTGPQIGFGPGTPSVAAIAGAKNPLGAAVDASGNLYIADNSADKVFKIAPGGTQTTVGSGFSGPAGVAVDGAGNIYVADTGAAAVYKIPADGTAQTTVGTGFSGPLDVAVDTVGNIFVADAANDVVKLPADGSAQSTVISSSTLIAGTALNGLWGLAVDAADNVYIADGNNARVVKVPGNGGSPTVLLTGLEQPWAVALDAAGDLYVSDTDHDRILELPAGSSSPVTLVSSAATFGSPAESLLVPSGLALDASGNIYLVDNGNKRVVTLNRAAVPSLAAAFASTVYGDTSAAQTVTVNNTGNTGLAFSALSIASGFLQQSSGGTDCSATATVDAGANCTLQLAFQPTSAAAISGSAILTDNAGNVTGTTQTIALGGAGTAATITPSLTGTVSKTYDATTTATLAAANYTFTGTVGSDDVGITTPASGTYDTANVGTGKTVTVAGVALTGSAAANYQLSTTAVAGPVGVITPAALAVSANPAGMTYGGTLPAFTGTVTGALTGDSFTESFTTTATTSSPAGAYSIVPAVAGAHLADYTVTPTPGTLTVAKAPLAVTAAAVSIAYGSVPPAFTAQYSGFVNGDSAATALSGAPSLSTAATSASPVGTYPIVVAAGTLGAANYTFAFTNAALTVTAASQSISFAAIPSQSNYTTPLTLAATASSGLPVAFSVVSGPATVSGSTLTLTGEGTVVVEADQAGNGNYLAAPPVRQTVAVGGPEAILTPASLGFGNQVIGAASAAQVLTLQNPGSAPLAIAAIAASGDFAQTNNCTASLAAGASCSILVVFTPSALGSRSGAVAVSDNAPSPQQSAALAGTGVDFNLSLASGASTNNTIDAGGTATYSLSLASDAFTGTVALACTGAPANATCTVTPASSALSPGAAAAVTVSVVTTARSIVPPVPGSRPPSWPWLLLLTLPALGWLWRRRQYGRRALPAWLLGAVAGAALLAAGCGGVSNLPNAGGGTAAGTYTITVTATAGAAARSVSLGLAVN